MMMQRHAPSPMSRGVDVCILFTPSEPVFLNLHWTNDGILQESACYPRRVGFYSQNSDSNRKTRRIPTGPLARSGQLFSHAGFMMQARGQNRSLITG
jgi:hypothetical protein